MFLIATWLVYAQCGMQKRISDIKAKKQFAQNGISLTTADFVANGQPGTSLAPIGSRPLPKASGKVAESQMSEGDFSTNSAF